MNFPAKWKTVRVEKCDKSKTWQFAANGQSIFPNSIAEANALGKLQGIFSVGRLTLKPANEEMDSVPSGSMAIIFL